MDTTSTWAQIARGIATRRWPEDPAQVERFVRQMAVESDSWAPDVIECRRTSAAGAEGIAQIIRSFHPTVDPCDPIAALTYAAGLMAQYLAAYGDIEAALAAYNWGPGNLQKAQRAEERGTIAAWRDLVPAETRTYWKLILEDTTMPAPSALSPLYVTRSGLILPVAGPLTQGFGHTEYAAANPGLYGPNGHEGIDIGAGTGASVRSVTAGVVSWAGLMNRRGERIDDGTGLGQAVMVDAPDGTQHRYGHLDSISVHAGFTVIEGMPLGTVGETGAARGPHLHYEIRRGGVALDPLPYLQALTASASAAIVPGPPAWAKARVTATDGLRFRAMPSDTASILAIAPIGEVVELRADWVPVRYQGRDGWMHAGYLTLIEAVGLSGLTAAERRILAQAAQVMEKVGLAE